MNQGGLHIPGPMGVGRSQEQQIHQTWSTFDEMELLLVRSYGVHPPEQPKSEIPRITARILTDADNREFSQIFANFGEWYGFITALYGRVQALLVEVNNEMSDLEVQNRQAILQAWKKAGGNKKDKPTIVEMSDYNAMQPRVRELKFLFQKWEQQRLMLAPRKEQLYRDMKILSRQVEIRGQEIERNRLGGNMAGRQHIPRGQQ